MDTFRVLVYVHVQCTSIVLAHHFLCFSMCDMSQLPSLLCIKNHARSLPSHNDNLSESINTMAVKKFSFESCSDSKLSTSPHPHSDTIRQEAAINCYSKTYKLTELPNQIIESMTTWSNCTPLAVYMWSSVSFYSFLTYSICTEQMTRSIN